MIMLKSGIVVEIGVLNHMFFRGALPHGRPCRGRMAYSILKSQFSGVDRGHVGERRSAEYNESAYGGIRRVEDD